MQFVGGSTAVTLSRGDLDNPAVPVRTQPLAWLASAGRLVRRGLIWLVLTVFLVNGVIKGAFALLAAAILWENWLQFHPWVGAVIGFVAVAIILGFPDRQPPEPELSPATNEAEDELRGAFRITVSRRDRPLAAGD